MIVFSVREVIEQAVQTEKLGYEFYTALADRFKDNEETRKFFITLASKELRHEKMFEDLMNFVKDESPENWEEVSHYLRAVVESAFFLGEEKATAFLKKTNSVNDAVNFAIGFEKETLLYYIGVRDGIREKEVVDEIINEERTHITWLNKFKEGLED